MISLIFFLFLQDPAAHAQSKKLNTNLYESEDKGESFTAKVRVVRDIADDVEVFFDSDKAHGAYTLPKKIKSYATVLKTLQDSGDPTGSPVTVTVDADKNILSVEKASGAARKKSSNPYDPGHIPDI